MNILVCVKQVPDTTEIKINPETNTLMREGVPSIVNPFDAFAMEAAARIKDEDPNCKIVALSMGPEQAKAALKECIAIAADKAYLVSDRAFGGADTLATSYTLSCAIKQLETLEGKFDAIFCGKQAIDGDTAQVGPELAEHLDYPQVTYAWEAHVEGDRLKVLKETENSKQVIGVQMPCVITFTKPNFDPRYPNIKRQLMANRMSIPTLSKDDLPGLDIDRIGMKGSPTHVKKSFVPRKKGGGVVVRESTDQESALKLAGLLSDANII